MDRDFLEQMYHLHFNKTYRTAYLVTGDHQLAEDAAQEAFLKAFANLDKLRDRQKFGPWVCTIASNYGVDLLRKNKKVVLTAEGTEIFADNNPGHSPEEAWDKKELSAQVKEALFMLDPEDREILVLKYFNDMSINEIAALSSSPAGTVKSRLFRARGKVRHLLQPEEHKNRQLNKTRSQTDINAP